MSTPVLTRARNGDEQAFSDLVEPHRRELYLHCYRMLGSLADAEDALQETLLAAWRGLGGFSGQASLSAWLYRIATNQCLNALRGRRRRPQPPVPPFRPPSPTREADVTWLQPFPDSLLEGAADPAPGPEARYQTTEAIELAFIAGLARMSPRQAAVLVLRDVLGFSAADVAGMLGTTPVSVKGVLQRARAALRDAGGPAARRAAPPPGSARERAVSQRFAAAYAADDIDGVVALLTDDAWLSMPPAPHEYQGPAAIADFLRASATWRGGRRFRLVPTRANTQPAFGCYLPGPQQQHPEPAGVLVLTLDGDRISAITRFLDDGLLRRFGLCGHDDASRRPWPQMPTDR